ncbi:MAG: hypothetical protein IPL33_16815 [Sphingobacteriales bacterium]|nr:hypothetical protein [Sphingobacteriales bacterium]
MDITEINGAQIYYYYASNVNDANGNPLPFVFNGSTQNTVTLSENYEVFVVGSMGCQTFVGSHSCTCEGLDIDVSCTTIPGSGNQMTVTITGEPGSSYIIVNSSTGGVLASNFSASAISEWHAV